MKSPVGIREPARVHASVTVTFRVLVVDDEELFAQRLGNEFEQSGFVTLVVGDGQSALDRARDWAPDLIILDVRMPGMDGVECLRRLRCGHATHPPVILLTADEGAVVDAAACLYGGCYLLRKPCPREHVIALAERILA